MFREGTANVLFYSSQLNVHVFLIINDLLRIVFINTYYEIRMLHTVFCFVQNCITFKLCYRSILCHHGGYQCMLQSSTKPES